jgi:lipid A ethanolaminephosphotransferase
VFNGANSTAQAYPMVSTSLFCGRCALPDRLRAFSPLTLMALAVGFVFVADNRTFWSIGAQVFSGHPVSFAGFMLAVFSLTLGAFSLFAWPWVVKPFAVFILLLGAVASYYTDTLGVIIDRDMIQNVMVTTVAESKHLITFGFVAHVVLFGVLPALLVCLARVRQHGPLRTLATPVLGVILGFSIAAGLLFADLKSYSSILRERKDFMSSYQPGGPLVGGIRYAKMMARTVNVTLAITGADAHKGPAYTATAKPVLTVVVAGETARALNFSLNGYSRATNPGLSQLPITNFSAVSSCGTATATSLPCMFSKFTRSSFSYEKGISHENVLDVIARAGLHVEWWDNNTGDKNIADRITARSFAGTQNAQFCAAGECMDGIFLQALKNYAAGITEDTVLVLHQIGSHGPTYHLRYPPAFEQFTPACRTAEFKKCTPQQIINAYDNTILYTDEILAQIIALLGARDSLATAMLYVSDHGESLGEGGLYLHGTPYFMAPKEQTHVPMILWLSDAFTRQFSLDGACIADQRDAPLSHDNLFHSLLGLLDIVTEERDTALDIFTPCRTARPES